MILKEAAEELVTRWEKIAESEQPGAATRSLLRDRLPDYVRRLGHEFCKGVATDEQTAEATGHGEQRWDMGWKLPEMIQDYHILRRVLLGFLDQGPASPLKMAEAIVLNRALDDAVIAAVTAFVTQADERWESLNSDLEQRVSQRTAQLRTLSLELVQAENREREKLAHTLHDGVQQTLAAAKMHLVGCAAGADAQGAEGIREACNRLDESIDAVRTLSVELVPPILFRGGLGKALEWLGTWMEEKHGLSVVVSVDDSTEPAMEEVRTFLFHIARELLFNVVKHSGVRKASVELQRLDEGHVRLIVADEGKGFDRPIEELRKSKTGWGLAFISGRVEAMGGRLDFCGGKTRGACVAVDLPTHPSIA